MKEVKNRLSEFEWSGFTSGVVTIRGCSESSMGTFTSFREVDVELRRFVSSGSVCCDAAMSLKSMEGGSRWTAWIWIRDNASAGELSLPFTCRMSEVNCDQIQMSQLSGRVPVGGRK